ncbi:hypothetical protein P280DRAFT_172664 [Massarina eburnea CBS 473.64]|uniref:GH16 domain-containing protein n=1 Tax=Massarina eburnea CBS 473.64 TaxID=1395130 RepID=A0A6A6SE63_9PLEO|nr:hypothetical protein P280DRAFT_172664 [Massarina eburnea CBS 473.64]
MVLRNAFTVAFAAAALVGSTAAQATGSREKLCPAETPCCGLYGDCGIGAFCLGGCDITMSHSFKACVPNPVCKSGTYKLDSLDDVQDIGKYLGDNSKINWQAQGTPKVYNDGLLLTMSEDSSGTLLASTFYVWYGKICAKMTTSQGRGVVTAFIMMSDVKDEIDFEFIGTDINHVQSNFYSQGVTDYTQTKNLTVSPETVSKPHEYCLDWKPEELTWSVDGSDMRTVKKSDTWNATANHFAYPQTPSRIMLSLWPAGKAGNAEGTVNWAGGAIDWHSPYMTSAGYYAAKVDQVTVECYDPPSGVKKTGNKSYKYTDKAATNDTVEISNDFVILGSLEDTGENPGDASKTKTSTSTSTNSAPQVPGGIIGGGGRQEPTAAPQSTGSSGSSGSSSSDAFDQGTSGKSAGVAVEPSLHKIGGSAIAIVVTVLGLLVL